MSDSPILIPDYQLRRTDDLVLDPNNARDHSQKQIDAIARSIQAFGFLVPCVVAGDTVRAGEGRYRAALQLDLPEVPTIKGDHLSAEQLEAYALADNRLAEGSTWNQEKLAASLNRLNLSGFDMKLTAFDARALKRIKLPADVEAGSGDSDDELDVIPEYQAKGKTTVKRGQVWKLGDHVVICGDCLKPNTQNVIAAHQDKDAACVLTDPPYAIYGSSTGMAADIADDSMVLPFFTQVYALLEQRVRWFGHVYVFCDWRSFAAIERARYDGAPNCQLRNVIVWDKGGGMGTNYVNGHEWIQFLHKLPEQTAMGKRPAGVRTVASNNVMKYGRVPSGKRRGHNAAKPVALLQELIQNSTDPDDLVFDPFLGSGSTLVAAETTGRRVLAVEKEPRWVDVILQRWAEMDTPEAELLT